MTKHHERRTRGRIFMIIAILIVGYIIFDRIMENYNKSTPAKASSNALSQESTAKLIAAKESIKVAPKWKLNNLSGNPFDSESLAGNVVLITFWSSDCPVCRSEIPLLRELDEQYKDKGFRIVAIAFDEHEDDDLYAFTIGERMNYTVLRGDTKVAKKFGDIEVVPQSFLVDRQGKIIKFFLGKINEGEIKNLINSKL